VLYCWKELDWGGGRTCHVHPDGSVSHGGAWPPPPRMRRLVYYLLLYASAGVPVKSEQGKAVADWRESEP
jgi:hypothetical protein